MVATVAGAYAALPAAQRAQACILTGNYGGASAVDFFGPRRGLPAAISPHNNYYIWGPGGCTGSVVLSIGLVAAVPTPAGVRENPAGRPGCAVPTAYRRRTASRFTWTRPRR